MTRLAILWHMHQPFYEDLATGEHILPWVRLHAIKDYWGMAALLREFPAIRVTFNLVPSLLVQIQAFADDRATDRHLAVGLKPSSDLDAAERTFLVANGFHAPVERMIRPYPRYAELHARRHRPDTFSVDDLRDLQVLHKLAWMDQDWSDPRLLALAGKERGYTEEDKRILREVELELLRAVIPMYRELAVAGRIELSTSPYYHPILPLVCDTDTHLRAHPHSALPRRLFAQPADAREQIRRAVRFHEQMFGTAPAGMWPSEGSVSDEALRLIANEGLAWAATDEEILARTLQRAVTADTLYRPYEVHSGERTIRCLFRDHALSDAIGFVYQSWDPAAAADDFVGRVREAARRFRSGHAGGSDEGPVITVILDGENAWEHYSRGGRPFLRALYQRLSDTTDIETVTMSAAAAAPARPLAHVLPGSWINGDFYIWAGHADDHRAWGQLAAARRALDKADSADPASRERALDEVFIAEGSDWFWWYGDDHSSDQDREFDDLFRRHLRNVYAALGQAIPDDLFATNITTGPVTGPIVFGGLTSPVIDGRITHFAEWSDSVDGRARDAGGAMQRVSDGLVQALRVGCDRTTVYLRIDGRELARRTAAGELRLVLVSDQSDPPRRLELAEPIRWAAADIVEVAIPIGLLGAQTGDRVRLSILVVERAGQTLERHPSGHPLDFVLPTRHLSANHWTV